MSVRAIFRRTTKTSLVVLAVIFASLFARYLYVQNQIKTAPVEITQHSASRYTPPGVFGHGNLVSADGTFGWYIYDINDHVHGVRKACVNSITPRPDWDIDFIYSDGRWYKLRSGLGRLSKDSFKADPATEMWKGLISRKLTFPVRKPDLSYRAKILVSKLKDGTQSPLEYLQSLKAANPSCTDMPAP